MIRINPIRIALVAPATFTPDDRHDVCEKKPIPDPPDDCEKLTRIVDFPDSARRAVDPATFIEVTPDDCKNLLKI